MKSFQMDKDNLAEKQDNQLRSQNNRLSDEKDKIVKALQSQKFPVNVKEFDGNKFWVYTTYKGVRWYWYR